VIADRLRVFRARFLERSRDDGAFLLDAVAAPEPDLLSIAQVAHRLAGGGGTVGLPEISAAAATLEQACDDGDEPAVRLAVDRLCAVIDAWWAASAG
jgi:HPt (histidine-containing phosphotransfer) domain-containing protein